MTLLETITEKAEKTFVGPITLTNYNAWIKHWINTAIQWHNELLEEELFETCDKIWRHIQDTSNDLKRRQDVRFTHYKQFPLFAHANFVFYSMGYEVAICHWAVPGTWREE